MLWTLTAREVGAIFDGIAARHRREHDERMEMAWVTARLTAYAPEKPDRFLKLEKLLRTPRSAAAPRQTWQAQESILASW